MGPLLAVAGYALAAQCEPTAPSPECFSFLLGYAFLFCCPVNMSTAKPSTHGALALLSFNRTFLWRWLRESAGPGLGRATGNTRRLPGSCVAAVPGRRLPGPFWSAVVNGGASQRGNTVFRDFVTAAFASLPKDAIVVTMAIT